MATLLRSRNALSLRVFAIQSRQMSSYGYEQAQCLSFAKYGEPKEVLKLHRHSISPAHGNLVTIKFLASPINPADINQIQGVYPSKPTFSGSIGSSEPLAVGGNEGLAEVVSVGNKVSKLRCGDWVIMNGPGFGTWRTHAQTTEDKLAPIRNHEGVTPEQVGTVSINPLTAYRMLRDFVPLQQDEWFIQNGANSGVGRAAIQLGKEWGYKSINIVRQRKSEEQMASLREELKTLGADVVVTDEEVQSRDFPKRVEELTGKAPVRLALNCVGGPLVNFMAKMLAPGSHVVTYGAMSKQPVSLPMGLLIFKNITFSGFWVSQWSKLHPEQRQKCIDEVLDLTRAGKFKDTPMQKVKWTGDGKSLIDAVQGTLDGFRDKSIFIFE
ncbi:putative mitochondrial enoyl reductase [Piedraia hortae CBS 480.64]|uniref:enoyl-[acyl-carrier-protein] reductase n=1 Tax=Piedraia hortae CBS 480.64 TaxID=1314780 RepID=A0A6A7C9V0_9PEZI|nr:putative mitochondrial enoyl reductase [Piedraia hortae CBS 480.64]